MLTKKQRLALELLIESDLNQKEIASVVKVSEQTIINWKKKEEFMTAYNDAVKQNIKLAAGRALKRELQLLKKADSDHVCLNAAKDILDRAGFKAGNGIDKSQFNMDDGFIEALKTKAGEVDWEK